MYTQKLNESAFLIHDFLSGKECRDYIFMSEDKGYETSDLRSLRGKALQLPKLRNNYRLILDDVNMAEHFWKRFKSVDLFDIEGYQPIGLNERFRFYRYSPMVWTYAMTLGMKTDTLASLIISLATAVSSFKPLGRPVFLSSPPVSATSLVFMLSM